MKKLSRLFGLILVLGLILSSSAALAGGPDHFVPPVPPPSRDCYLDNSFYVGGLYGPQFNDTRISTAFNSGHINPWALTTGVFLGYGGTVSLFHLAAEVTFTINTLRQSHDIVNRRLFTGGGVANSFWVSLLPGLVLGQNGILYGRVAYVSSRVFQNYVLGLANLSTGQRLSGVKVGFGMQFFISHCVSWRWEYDYTNYGTARVVIAQVPFRVKTETNEFLSSIMYNFAV